MNPVREKVGEWFSHVFLPRKSNNQRPRILHPAGLSVLVASFLVLNSLRSLVSYIPGLVLGFSSSVTIDEVIKRTNDERAKVGLSPLTQNPQLSQAAYAKAADMFTENYWAHVSPTGTEPWAFIKQTGYRYRYAGENLARDFSETSLLMDAWMASPTHKENILSGNYRDIGVAVVDGTLLGVETRLVVQMFGSPIAAPIAQRPRETTPVAPPVKETETVVTQEVPVVQTQPGLEEVPFFRNTSPKLVTPQFAGTSIFEGSMQSDRSQRLISPNQVTQTFGLMLVALILGTLVVDWAIAHRRRTVRLVGKNWAHLMFLGAAGLMMLEFAGGKIL